MTMRLAALLVLLLLASCTAAPPVPLTRAPPIPYPPSVRERLLAIAEAEWREWGSVVIEADGARTTPEGAEARPANFPRVLAYWRAVPDDEGAIAANRELYAAALRGAARGAALWQEPAWSAAFISYLMVRAGVDVREFPPNAAHGAYIDALIRDARDYPATAPFVPHSPASYAPRAGDLLCADRSATPLADWRQRVEDGGRFRPLHCDLVVAARPGVVEAIGGNVADAVTLTRFATDAAGRLLPRPPGAPVLFLVLQNRLGQLPPWTARVEEGT